MLTEDCKISVIAPCRNEETFIIPFLDNMVAQDYPKDGLEILLIDGCSDDRTVILINEYIVRYPFIKLLNNPYKTVPFALNTGIMAARGRTIIRVDIHAVYPVDYLSELEKQLYLLGCENVGGALDTLPAGSKTIAGVIAVALSNSFGIGNAQFRLSSRYAGNIQKADTVPFGCFPRKLFDRIGLFDEELVRNQDDEFNARIIKNGGKIYLLPYLRIKYYPRDSVNKMMKMFYQYGLFKPLVNKKIGYPATIRQFVPLCFLLGIVGGVFLSFFSKIIFSLFLSVLILYLLLSLYATRREIAGNPRFILYLPWVFMSIHLSYGWGYFMGIFRFNILDRKSASVDINR